MGRGEEWRDTEFKGVISENVAGGTRKSNHIFPCRFLFFFLSFRWENEGTHQPLCETFASVSFFSALWLFSSNS